MVILLLDADVVRRARLAAALTERSPHTLLEVVDADEAVVAANGVDHVDAIIMAGDPEGATGVGLLRSLRMRFPSMRGASVVGPGLRTPPEGVKNSFSEPFDGAEILHWVQRGADAPSATDIPDELGNYRLRRLLVETKDMLTFEATQRSVDRPVLFQLLRPSLAEEPAELERFQSRLRAKAALVHHSVAPIYERGEEHPFYYYTAELLKGESLLELARTGRSLSEGQVAKILEVTADVMRVMDEGGLSRRYLTAGDVYVDADSEVNLANVAVPGELADADPAGRDILTLLNNLRALAPEGGAATSFLDHQLDRGLGSWAELLEAVEEASLGTVKLASGWKPAHAAGSPGFFSTKAGKLTFALAPLAALLIGLGVWMAAGDSGPEVGEFNKMIRIGQGSSLGPDGTTLRLPTFWIDEYEVTIAQYALFLDALEEVEKDGGDPAQFDHPDQPEDKAGHRPEGWAALYAAASSGNPFGGEPVDLNCPIFLVDWWDANAYAKWKGRRLPTAEEWSKAARGRENHAYPWGDQPQRGNANLGSDYVPGGAGGGGDDGYNSWAPVDALPLDLSTYGVRGMAGNVEEWTDSWVAHADYPDRRVPGVIGGSFATPARIEVWRPRTTAGESEASGARGFRTASDSDPELAPPTPGE